MTKLKWGGAGQKRYETGVKNGVLYLTDTVGDYTKGVAWNGLTTVTESPSGAEANPQYADNKKYLNLISAEEFGGTIEAFTYPDEFEECDGTAEIAPGVTIGQQKRKTFGFSYRTEVGDDLVGLAAGYKLHLVYGALAAPSEKARATINDSPEALAFSWEFTTTAVEVDGYEPSATVTIDSTTVTAAKMAAIEAILYGTDSEEARLPFPDEVATILAGTGGGNTFARVTNVTPNEDGTAFVTGTDIDENSDGTADIKDDLGDDSSTIDDNPDGTADITVKN